jgi:hypothetical protein
MIDLRTKTNAELATALEYIGSMMKGGISDAIMKEAAKRLREQHEPQFVERPPPYNPPLKAEALLTPTAESSEPPAIRGYLTLPKDYLKDE